jgi:hypothetical protein
MAQQQVLAFGVDGGPLKSPSEPGGTNLNRTIVGPDVQISR